MIERDSVSSCPRRSRPSRVLTCLAESRSTPCKHMALAIPGHRVRGTPSSPAAIRDRHTACRTESPWAASATGASRDIGGDGRRVSATRGVVASASTCSAGRTVMRFAQPLHTLRLCSNSRSGARPRRASPAHDAVHVLMRHAGDGSSSSIIPGRAPGSSRSPARACGHRAVATLSSACRKADFLEQFPRPRVVFAQSGVAAQQSKDPALAQQRHPHILRTSDA